MSHELRSEFADADDSPGLVLWQVTYRWQATVRAALAPLDLTHVQFVLLASLTYLDGAGSLVTQRALADWAATDPMMTSQVVRALAAKDLVTRRDHPVDGRAKVLAVTDAGAALANRAIVVVERADAEFFAPLGDHGAEFARLLRTLRRPRAASTSGD